MRKSKSTDAGILVDVIFVPSIHLQGYFNWNKHIFTSKAPGHSLIHKMCYVTFLAIPKGLGKLNGGCSL